MIKKILFILLSISSLFLLTDNVFAADLNGNNTTSSMPPFLKDYYAINSSDAECDDTTDGYCNIYHYLEQHFSEYFTLYKNVVLLEQENRYSGYSYTYVYFFADEPYISETNVSNFANAENITFLNHNGNPLKFYRIGFRSDNKNIKIKYFSEYYNETKVPIYYDDRSTFTKILTNFDLYSQNGNIYHETDVQNWTYVNLKSATGLMLVPKRNSSFSSYFSYNKANTYISWYDFSAKTNIDYLKLDPPISSTLSYYINFTDDRIGKYYFVILNKGSNTTEIGYVSNDFDIVIFEDLYSSAIGSNNVTYDNPLADIFKDINDDVVFDSSASILDNIVSFFSHFGDFLGSLATNIVNGIGNIMKDLFIPSGNFLNNWFNDMQKSVEKQLGFLSYPITWILNILNKFLTLNDTGHYIISWSAIKVPNFDKNIIEAGSFDLASLLENSTIRTFHSLYITVVNALMLLAFMNLCMNTYNRIFGGDVDTYEYLTVDEGYTVNDDGTTTHSRVTTRRKL